MFRNQSIRLKNLEKIFLNSTQLRQIHNEKSLCATAAVQPKVDPNTTDYIDPEWETAKPFEQIPGPSILSMIRKTLPGGSWFKKDLVTITRLMTEEYGPILIMPGMLGRTPMVLTYDEKDFEKIYRTEGVWPVRPHLNIVDHYRLVVKGKKYEQNAGLLVEDGERWYTLRTKVNPIMLMPKTVKRYLPSVDNVACDFIKRIKSIRKPDKEMPDNFFEELNKWSLESIGTIALETRIGCFETIKNPEVERIIEAVRNFFKLTYELEFEPSLWPYITTPAYTKMINELNIIEQYIAKYVEKNVEKYNNPSNVNSPDHEESVMEKLLKIDKHCAIVMSSDLVFAGIDTTSTYTASVLLELGRNPEKQQKLYEEVCKILPTKDSPLTSEAMANAPYLRACLKEALRTSPVITGNGRMAGQDIVLSGYKIPKGTMLSLGQLLLQSNDKYFEKSKEFIPERWLKTKDPQCPIKSAKDTNPFIYLPFGHGPRSCVGRRFAELEVEVIIMRLIREFKIEWNHGPLKYNLGFIMTPTTPLNFKFTERSD